MALALRFKNIDNIVTYKFGKPRILSNQC